MLYHYLLLYSKIMLQSIIYILYFTGISLHTMTQSFNEINLETADELLSQKSYRNSKISDKETDDGIKQSEILEETVIIEKNEGEKVFNEDIEEIIEEKIRSRCCIFKINCLLKYGSTLACQW